MARNDKKISIILVHKSPTENIRYCAATLEEVVGIIINSPLPAISIQN